MPHESAQPFTDPTQRNPRDTELVGKVLGTEQAADMQELTGDQPTEQRETPTDLEQTTDEKIATTEAEKNKAELRHDEYVTWAEKISRNEDWVDETFIFEKDGRVRVEGDLHLKNTGISELPPDLYKVEGELSLENNKIKKIENIPESVTKLFLGSNQIRRIENIPESVVTLDLRNNQITKIENIPDSVTWLDLADNQIEIIENIPGSVAQLILSNNQIKIIENIPNSVQLLVDYGNPAFDAAGYTPESTSRFGRAVTWFKDILKI